MHVSPPGRTITVAGHGKISVTPDEARIQIGVQATAATAREASATANEAMNAVLQTLKDGGVTERAIHTGYFTIQPEYDRQGTQQRIGHSASNTVNVTITALDTLGTILDAVIDAGGDNILINNIAFAASEPVLTQAQAQAQHTALTDARQQAEMIAQTMDVTLGVILMINAGDVPSMQPMPRFALARMANAPTPVQAGEMDITASVQVIYAIAG